MTVDTLLSPSPPRSKEVANERRGGEALGVHESLLPCKMLYPPLSSRLESSLWTTWNPSTFQAVLLYLFFRWILICVPSWTVLCFGKFSRKLLLFIGLCLAENWFQKLSKNWKLQVKLLCLAIPRRFLITRKYGESLKFFVKGTALLLNFLSIKHDMTVHFFVSTHFCRCTTPLARNSRTCNIYLGGCWHSFLCSLQSYQESWQVCKGIWLLEVCEVKILDHCGQ